MKLFVKQLKMKKIGLYFILVCCNLIALAQSKQTVTKGTIGFQIKNMGINTEGSFGGLEAAIQFDKDHLSTSNITASVDTRTLSSENEMRDKHLKKEDYFDVDEYPKITMKSISFKHKSGNNYLGVFDLTIKTTTKRIVLPFAYIVNGSTTVYKGSFKINRLDFNVGNHSMILSNEATISINVETAL